MRKAVVALALGGTALFGTGVAAPLAGAQQYPPSVPGPRVDRGIAFPGNIVTVQLPHRPGAGRPVVLRFVLLRPWGPWSGPTTWQPWFTQLVDYEPWSATIGVVGDPASAASLATGTAYEVLVPEDAPAGDYRLEVDGFDEAGNPLTLATEIRVGAPDGTVAPEPAGDGADIAAVAAPTAQADSGTSSAGRAVVFGAAGLAAAASIGAGLHGRRRARSAPQ